MSMNDTILKLDILGKGILAADESTPTIKSRFESVSITSTPETRHDYRHTIFSAKGLQEFISGVILFDETIKNEETIKPLIDSKIVLGVKVDTGAKPYNSHLQGERLTEGLDGLSERLRGYKRLGAEFAKWRAVLAPKTTVNCLRANARALAIYAKKCQKEGIVPIVEPEILMDGTHGALKSFNVTEHCLHCVFDELWKERVELESIILKPNMVMSGYKNDKRIGPDIVAELTIACFKRTVPSAVPVIAFLSGGQPKQESVENLNAMNQESPDLFHPWYLTFSFGRELQKSALKQWSLGHKDEAQKQLLKKAKDCSNATWGEL